MNKRTCSCGHVLIPDNTNYAKPKGLVVFDYPSYEDVTAGALMVKTGRAYPVMYSEFLRSGLAIDAFWSVSFIPHAPNKECQEDHSKRVIDCFKDLDVVLLVGSEAASKLLMVSASEYYGLTVPGRWKGVSFVCCPSPLSVPKSSVGEFRLAIENFSALVKAKEEKRGKRK